jgi:hypothetical protein
MKKYLLILFVLGVFITSYAQEATSKGESAAGLLGEKTRLGINFNPLFSWARTPGAQTDNKGVRMGFQVGLQVDYYFAKNYGLTTGLYFDYLGTNVNYTLSKNDSIGNPINNLYVHKYTTQFLEVPFGLKLRTNEFKRITIYGELGVASMFLVSARATYNNDFDGVKKDQIKVYGTRVNFFDVAASGGAGIEYNIAGKTSLVAGVVYKYAFLNHIKDDKAKDVKSLNIGLAEDPIYLNYFAFRIGVLF